MVIYLNKSVPYTRKAKSLPDKSRAEFIAAPVLRPNVSRTPINMGTRARGMRYLGMPAFLWSMIAAIENMSNAVPATWVVSGNKNY